MVINVTLQFAGNRTRAALARHRRQAGSGVPPIPIAVRTGAVVLSVAP